MADITKIATESQVPRDQVSGADLITVKRDFEDAYWTKTVTAINDAGVAPDGTFTASRLDDDNADGLINSVYRDVTTTAQAYLASVDVRSETGNPLEEVRLWVRGHSGGATDSLEHKALLLTGEVVAPLAAGGDLIYSDVLTDLNNGYHRLRIFFNSDGGTVRLEISPPVDGSMLAVDPVLVPLPYLTPYNANYSLVGTRLNVASPGAENARVAGAGVLSDEREIENG